jgi:hypothetical protein
MEKKRHHVSLRSVIARYAKKTHKLGKFFTITFFEHAVHHLYESRPIEQAFLKKKFHPRSIRTLRQGIAIVHEK